MERFNRDDFAKDLPIPSNMRYTLRDSLSYAMWGLENGAFGCDIADLINLLLEWLEQ